MSASISSFRGKLTIFLLSQLLLPLISVLHLHPAQAREKISTIPSPAAVSDSPQAEQRSPSESPAPDPVLDEQESLDPQGESSEEPSAGSSGADKVELPTSDPNPLNASGDSLDIMIQHGMNADLWQQMKGGLPCVDVTTECIAQLQDIAVQENPLLKEVDARIEEINSKIEEAKAANKKSIDLSILRPAARVFLEPSFPAQSNPNQRQPGSLEKIAQAFTSPVGVVNELLKAVGIPLLDKLFGGNDQNQQRAIAISDLQVKLAEIQRGRAELADKVKEKIVLAVFDFDASRREFQISQEIVKRGAHRMRLYEVDYRMGIGVSDSYLNELSSLDKQKAQTFKAWTSLRAQLETIKLLVLGSQDS